MVRQPMVNPDKAVPKQCHNCGTKHVEFMSGGKCPAYNTKCDFCERLGHYKVKCRANKNQISGTGDKPKEASEFMWVWDSTGNEHEVEVMQWDSGDLSLIKGIMMQGEDARGHAFNRTRRVLKHMRYDKDSGHFVATEKRKQNRVTVGYQVDADNHRILKGMLDKANGLETMIQSLPNEVVNRESVADTGATVVCGGKQLMQDIGIKMEQLLPTNITLFTEDKKSRCVLGAVPVVITIGSEDGGSASMRDFLYIVEELSSVFISRDALASLGIIRKEFPKVPNNASLGWVAGVQGSSADTAIDQPCIKPTNFAGDTADCGCPVRELPPEPTTLPFEPTVENKEKMKQFLVEKYRASTFNTCQHQPLPMMQGPKMELFVLKDACPHAVYQPAVVTVNWEQKVK